MKTTAGKAKVAAVGSVLSVLVAVVTALADSNIDNVELQGIVGLAIVAGSTVYAVWWKKNYIIPPDIPRSSDIVPIAPGTFTDSTHAVISHNGENYYKASE